MELPISSYNSTKDALEVPATNKLSLVMPIQDLQKCEPSMVPSLQKHPIFVK